ncbi:MAG: IclR family transcriptional regulator [Planctomycetota bacterium]|nr:MAG: IclR family transcriptional regulator [Planctomycetota bacterium]
MTANEPRTDRYRAPALGKGLDILEYLADQPHGAAAAEIARGIGRSRSEIFRMLMCLEERSFIARGQDERFRLTARLFELAHRHPPTKVLLENALPAMRRLASRAAQSCHLGVLHDASVLIVAQVDAPGFVSVGVHVGALRDLTSSASGATLLAFQEPEARGYLLEQALLSAPARRALEQRLRLVARRGYEERPSAVVRGIVDISAPIRDHRGVAIAALTAPCLQQSGDVPPLDDVRRMLQQAAAEITERIGGVGLETAAPRRAPAPGYQTSAAAMRTAAASSSSSGQHSQPT